jgi:hypothetical protein
MTRIFNNLIRLPFADAKNEKSEMEKLIEKVP